MNAAFTPTRQAAIWLSPLSGAFAAALFLLVRALMTPDHVDVSAAFVVWFIERAAVGYLCALPLLGIAYRLGLRRVVGFMLLAALAALPLERYVSTPINAWHPTEEELSHGFYWDVFLPCALLASATGAMFAFGVIRKKEPNQPPEPTR